MVISTTTTVTVPSDAKYFFVYMESYPSVDYRPISTVFTKTVINTYASNQGQDGYVGGGTTGGGSYYGSQSAAGSGGSFGQGAN